MTDVEPQLDVKTEVSLEGIYREHGNRLWWAILAYAGDREIASDAVAEAFAQALRRAEDLRRRLRQLLEEDDD